MCPMESSADQKISVMDYSALVGVDDKTHTLTIGLIDTLGIFNLAKAIESNSKRVLQTERTIIPPDEYAARFRTALDEYILASPEKWSKTPGDDSIPSISCPL
jgi:1-phosphatidylinositol-3-phosphate 5-kinase